MATVLVCTALAWPSAADADGAARPAAPPPSTSKAKALVIRCGKADDQRVALTFDDGPTRKHTPRVLAILKQHKVRATFFVLGAQARRDPEMVKRIADEGHLLAHHSWDHPKRATLDEWRAQLQKTRAAIEQAGVKPSTYFRPPHGTVSAAVRQACGEQGYTILLYTLLSSDWTRPGVAALARQVTRGLGPGGVVVLHDGGGERSQTVAALPAIITGLRARGLEPVRLDELLGRHPAVHSCAGALTSGASAR